MKPEAAKEMDRKCVWDWLNKVYIAPSLSYSEYTDEEIRMFAHDALVFLKEQEAVEPYSMNAERTYGICPRCGKIMFRYGNVEENHYCGVCGKKVKWK